MSSSLAQRGFEVELSGCRPEPLASYLKALGVLRVVAEQADPGARGCWRGEHFIVVSALDREALVRFFAERWSPTPVIAPWNGGSGFYPKDNTEASDKIVASEDSRLRVFAEAIGVARSFVAVRGWTERPADENKLLMLAAMRAALPDEALAWLDAAVVIGNDRLLFPPLLGTGGNDGRLDFSNNYQQRVVEVLSSPSTDALNSALFGDTVTTRFKGAMGQYQPAAHERSNPWDFVLLIEGALLFAGAATRRFESCAPSVMAFPFHARAAAGLNGVTDSDEDDSRDELWLPLWAAPASLRELHQLFAEGRATVGSGDAARSAASALDFARAITGLGVDRGIDSFIRVGFHVRNGLAYFATPLGRFSTGEVRSARLLDDVDSWYDRLRQKTSSKNAPAGVALARRRLELAMFEVVASGASRPLMLALGDVERALAQSLGFTAKAFLSPVPRLQSAWATAVNDGSVEQRLAAALATRPGMRGRLVPLEKGGRAFGRPEDPTCVFRERPLVDNLHALLLREDIEAQQQQGPPAREPARAWCSLSDIAAFIEARTDDRLIERWLRAFVLVDGLDIGRPATEALRPSAAFAVIALVHHRHLRDTELPRTTGVLARACAGDSVGATAAAIRRLNASGAPLPFEALVEPVVCMRRVAAALALPLTTKQRRRLESMVLPAVEDDISSTLDAAAQEIA